MKKSSTISTVPPAPRAVRRVLLALDYYLHQVHSGVVEYARQSGWILDARTQHQRQLPTGWQADGILTFIGSQDQYGPELRASGVPMVNMSPWGAEHGIPTVRVDNHKTGELAARHLLGRGFARLAMVQFSPWSLTSMSRRQGFEQAVLSAGRQFFPLVCPIDETAPPARLLQWLGDVLLRLPKPLGVFTEGDLWAVETIHLCQQINLRVPDDVAVLGVDNDPMVVDVAPVPVSSVDNDLKGLGMQAAAVLDRIMSGQAPPAEPILIPPRQVVQRRSTNVIAVSNEEVASAITFIHGNFRSPITVTDVVNHSHASRRRLQDLFIEHVGKSISREILSCRLELAKQLLQQSPMKIDSIAQQCGLGNGVQLAKVFARELGITAKEYRQGRGEAGLNHNMLS